MLSIGMALFLAGRLVSTVLLGKFSSSAILTAFGLLNVVLTLPVALNVPKASTIALIGIFFGCGCTDAYIFALGLRGLGANTKRGAAALVFGVSGGVIIPPLMGIVADSFGSNYAYLVVTPYVVVALLGWKLHKPVDDTERSGRCIGPGFKRVGLRESKLKKGPLEEALFNSMRVSWLERYLAIIHRCVIHLIARSSQIPDFIFDSNMFRVGRVALQVLPGMKTQNTVRRHTRSQSG